MREQCVPHVIGNIAKRRDARVIGNLQLRGTRQDERGIAAVLDVLLEVVEQRLAALVAIDAPQVQHILLGKAEAIERGPRRRGRGRLEADADNRRWTELAPGTDRHERVFFRREEQEAGGTLKNS